MDTSNSGPVRRSGIESLGSSHQQYGPNRTPSAQQASAKQQPYPWNIARFYSVNDSPWVPQGIITGIPTDTQHGQHMSGSVGFPAAASFQNYRSGALPSECDTNNGDSGYGGSGAPFSIEATSVCDDDQNPEAQNTAQLIESFHLGGPPLSNSSQLPTWSHSRPPPSVATAPPSGDLKHYCSECNTWLKTRSELNVPQKASPSSGRGLTTFAPTYVAFIKRSVPPTTTSQNTYIELDEDLDSMLQNSTHASFEKSQSGLAPAHGEDNFLRPDILHGSGQRPLQSSLESVSRDVELSMSTDDDEPGSLDDVTEPAEYDKERSSVSERDVTHSKGPQMLQSQPEQCDIKMTDTGQEQSISAPRALSEMIPANLLGLARDPGALVEYLKKLPRELLKSALDGEPDDVKTASSFQDLTNQKILNPCTECNKTFARPCELKKHLKRHEKPYGCTFYHCSKAFGSKNDWKRHESSQHWQLESWKCEDKKMNQTQPCDKVCHRRESFKNHLNKEHMMTDGKAIEEKLERCRIGRHCDDRFWCGFCSKIIEITGEVVNAWTKRCDHIDDHFSGRDGKRKMNISEWIYVESRDQNRENGERESNSQPSTPDSGTSSTLKRKSGSEADTVSYKKQRQEKEYMWKCCGQSMQMKTSSQCFECDHQRCVGNCDIEVHQSQDDGLDTDSD
ncbi:hypothetical protein G7Z17_g11149 [Cylindrodendrum hubeiense]|uniref:C2H2-type domain-containing protein n=1 Tax=Cylindrodendrum hubeiense TaxID=595255 RepID=A0A9P5H046_9HYPO|nr:hypothetical protein G7Z17_g11149 [Cylindrodendrum hubeiense]